MITREELKQVLKYEPDTGLFTWKVKRSRISPGDVAGTKRRHDGKTYIIISINGKKYRAHRLVFLYMTGAFPDRICDHINGNGTDNRWVNLREVDFINNNRNMRLRADNTSGVTGVHWNKKDKRWQVSIKTGKDRGYIGQFKTFEEAVEARKKAERHHNFHVNHGSVRPL